MKNFHIADLNRNVVVPVNELILKEASTKNSAKEESNNNRDFWGGGSGFTSVLKIAITNISSSSEPEFITKIIALAIRQFNLKNIKYNNQYHYVLYLDRDEVGFTYLNLKGREANHLEIIRSLRINLDFPDLVA